jgi:hypothetical protein
MINLELEGRLIRAVAGCRGLGVPIPELDMMLTLVKAGEPVIAFEQLFAQLLKYQAKVPSPQLAELVALGRELKIGEEHWVRLGGT